MKDSKYIRSSKSKIFVLVMPVSISDLIAVQDADYSLEEVLTHN